MLKRLNYLYLLSYVFKLPICDILICGLSKNCVEMGIIAIVNEC